MTTVTPVDPALLHRWTPQQWLAWSAMPVLGLILAVWWQTVAGPSLQDSAQRTLFTSLNLAARAFPDTLWSCLTLLGETAVVFALIAPLLLIRPQAVLAAVAAAPFGGLLSVTLKRGFDAQRPAALLDAAQFHIIGPALGNASFPSGHTITAFAIAAAVLATLVPAYRASRSAVLIVGVVMMAALVGLSRVAVGAHWPVDVLAGAAVGWLAGLCGAAVARRYPLLWQTTSSQRLMAITAAGAVVWLVTQPSAYPLGAPVKWVVVAGAVGTLLRILVTTLRRV